MKATSSAVQFDLATTHDFDAIRRINHRTFAEEIPQHDARPDGLLVDRFENDSLFIVARANREIVGMLALRHARPFSLDSKLDNLDAYLPPGRKPCEVRLLAVDPTHRRGPVLRGLLARLIRECDARGLDLAVLSATTRQLKLYEHLGCVPFGDRVGSAEAAFQPMYVTREALVERVGTLLGADPHCFLTGPVTLAPLVRRRIAEPLESHRGERFARDLASIREDLGVLHGARHVAVFAGSGTLANDAVAAQLATLGGRGLVIANGEFGDRLAGHAQRHGLSHAVLRRPWGAAIDPDDIAHGLRRTGARWIWAVHCETSTGMLNDLEALRGLAAQHGAALALDAASSAGTCAFNLDGVAWATTVSGKALGAVAGLAIVCGAALPRPVARGVPSYLDLSRYMTGDGIPFTQPSLLVGALAESLATTDWSLRFESIARCDAVLRERMLRAGHRPLVARRDASPAVTTWVVPPGITNAEVGASLERRGFQLSWQSGYLRERGWIQSAFFGDFPSRAVANMADELSSAMAPASGDSLARVRAATRRALRGHRRS
jgi:aspartate aminotransferase-like enzyme/ribosomal protein S18 acetylase RimI-like enzyme